MLAVMLLPVGFRLAFLPWAGVPQPHFADEYGHLLVADTLAHGRLANPPHPLWRHLDTFYVLQHPAYAAQYPLGQGIMLATGKVLAGNPWVGVLLVTALMGGATCWALFDILPLRWAALAALLAGFAYGLHWINSYSYWGGQFCAFGGALLFGALVRLWRTRAGVSPSKLLATVAALGWCIIWLLRPFESVVPFLLFWSVLAFLALRGPWPWKRWLAPLAIVIALQACVGVLTAFHNNAVTRSPITFPYQAAQKINGVPQSFAWQSPLGPPAFRFAEMKAMYEWTLSQKQLSGLSRTGAALHNVWVFFVTPWFSLPLLLALFLVKENRVRVAWAIIVIVISGSLLYPVLLAHYIAAISCVMAFLIVRGFMLLWRWSISGRLVGRWVSLFLIVGGLTKEPLTLWRSAAIRGDSADFAFNSRAYLAQKLMRSGGRHVVFVRYGPHHIFHDEWVYNAADIDASPIVWCRWMGPSEDAEVMRYYKDRQYWTIDVDGGGVSTQVSRYPGTNEYAGQARGTK